MIRMMRCDCSILSLVLEGKWYDMIERGEKREEYRDAMRYWSVRLRNWSMPVYRYYRIPVVEFRCGYASDAPRMMFVAENSMSGVWVFRDKNERVVHPEWGEKAVSRYVIRLGNRIELEDNE